MKYYNPPASNMSTASRHPYPPFRCSVCGRFRDDDERDCWMDIGLWQAERRLGRVCETCQDQLDAAKAVTIGVMTGSVYVRPDYRLRLRALRRAQLVPGEVSD